MPKETALSSVGPIQFFLMIFFNVYEYVIYMLYTCVPCVCLIPMEARRRLLDALELE